MSWKVTTLRGAAEVSLGRQRSPQHADGPNMVRYLRAANVKDGELDLTDVQFMNFTPAEQSVFSLRPGDVLVTEGSGSLGSVGASAVWSGELVGTICFQNTLLRLRPRAGVDGRYLSWWARSAFGSGIFAAIASGANIYHLSAERLRSVEFNVPPLEEQCRIAEFLDAETSRIDALSKATIRQAELLDFRLIEAFRTVTTTGASHTRVQTGVPWMPEMADDRTLMKIGRAFLTGSGTTPRSDDERYFGGRYPWVNTGDLRDGVVGHPAKSVTERALRDYSPLRMYPPGALVVAMYGATTGRVGLLGVRACVNQACCVLTELGPINSRYLYFWFRGHRQEILRLAAGGGQPNISQDLVRSLKVPIPTYPKQEKVALQSEDIERDVSRQTGLLATRRNLLAERRQALITAAVTGQFDVTTASGRNTTQGV